MAEQWEYKVIYLTLGGNFSNTPGEWSYGPTHAPDIAVLLNPLGLEGWELVNANVYGSGNIVDNNVACFFKRRKS